MCYLVIRETGEIFTELTQKCKLSLINKSLKCLRRLNPSHKCKRKGHDTNVRTLKASSICIMQEAEADDVIDLLALIELIRKKAK